MINYRSIVITHTSQKWRMKSELDARQFNGL